MNKYHGWIHVVRNAGYADTYFVEHDVDGKRVRLQRDTPTLALEYFDKLAGSTCGVEEVNASLGIYRVVSLVDATLIRPRLTERDRQANELRTECQRLCGTLRRGLEEGSTPHASSVRKLCEVAEQLAELTK